MPNAGLGNKLFVWAKAHIFASINNLPLLVTGWTRLQKAALLHGGDLRLYLNYFKRIDQIGWQARFLALRAQVVSEPAVARVPVSSSGVVYEFSEVPSWMDYFRDIRAFRDHVREGLLNMLTPTRQKELATARPAIVCANVRLGDFRRLAANESFNAVGGVRTPLEYFRSLILNIREVHGSTLPVEIVTDGRRSEVSELLNLPSVSMAPKRSKIVDILMMSSSRILISSAGSTFSYWAGFLGECVFIHHPDHVHKLIRAEDVNCKSYEGPLEGSPVSWPSLVLANVRNIPCHSNHHAHDIP